MQQITLTALTKKGEQRLREIKAKTDIPLHDRLVYRQLYEERILKEHPYTLRISLKVKPVARLVQADDVINRFEIELEHRGVERGLDYTIEGE